MKKQAKSNPKKLLGKRVAELRRARGFSQSALSYDAAIDLSTLSRLERGELNVTIYTLIKLAETLDIEIRDLFNS